MRPERVGLTAKLTASGGENRYFSTAGRVYYFAPDKIAFILSAASR